jgi:ubiquinone/menaquinone biosynthesis C-methylase UbiE
MIELAQQYTPSCKFLLNQSDDLRLFERDFFDFVYSNIVLQHQETKDNAKAYIREFVRVVKPDGMIVFQIPSGMPFRRALQPRRRLYSILRALGFSSKTLYNRLRLNPMRTIWLSSKEVEATVSDAGGSLVRSYADDFNDESKTYVVTKKAGLARVAS